MKKVIDGKLYDTETANDLAQWDNGLQRTDFNYCFEELLRTSKGSYFLNVEGGVRTKYYRPYGQNAWGGYEDIVPLTIDEAKEWVESHCDGEKYCEIFGEPEEA